MDKKTVTDSSKKNEVIAEKIPRPIARQKWERERRGRMKNAFSKLDELIGKANESNCVDKEKRNNFDILQKAAKLIENLQKQVSDLRIRLKEPAEESESEIRIYLRALNDKCRTLSLKLRKLVSDRRKSLKKNPGVNSRKRLRIKPIRKDVKNKENIRKSPKFSHTVKLLPTTVFANGFKNGAVTVTPSQSLYFIRPDMGVSAAPPTIFLLPPGLPNQNCMPTSAPTSTTTVNRMPIPAYSHALSANSKKHIPVPISAKTLPSKKVSYHALLRMHRVLKEKEKLNKTKCNKELDRTKFADQKKLLENNADSQNIIDKSVKKTVPPSTEEMENVEKNITNEPIKETEAASITVSTNEKDMEISLKTTENLSSEISLKGKPVKENEEHIENIVKDLQKNNIDTSSQTLVIAPIDANKNLMPTEIDSNFEDPPLKKTKVSSVDEQQENVTNNVAQSITERQHDSADSNMNSEVVDATNSDIGGGRARLELAEEFLAASPTAAFLLTFPLVSGTRPDTPDDGSRIQTEVSNRNVVTSQAGGTINTNISHNSDGLDGLASFFSSKDPQYSKTMYSENKPWTSSSINIQSKEFTSKEISSCAMSNDFNPKSALPSAIHNSYTSNSAVSEKQHLNPDSINTNQSPTTKNSNYKQVSHGISDLHKVNDKSSVDNSNSNNLMSNPCYNFVNQYYSHEKQPDKLHNISKSSSSFQNKNNNIDMHVNYLGKSQISIPPRMQCDNNNTYFQNNYHSANNNNHNQTFGGQTKSAGAYPDYNISNIYTQNVNMWNEDVTYHDLNVQNGGNTKQGVNISRNHFHPHYGNDSHNFYKNFIPTAALSKQPSNKSELSQNSNQKNNSNVCHKQPPPDAKLEKDEKKAPIKGPVNWMTSEAHLPHSSTNSYMSNTFNKDAKFDHTVNNYPLSINSTQTIMNVNNHDNLRKTDYHDTQFYPIPSANYNFQTNYDDCQQNWSIPKLQKSEDLQMEPPSTLPTLIGDLALGTLERRRPNHSLPASIVMSTAPTETYPPSSTFFSVSQLVENTSTVVPPLRSQFPVDSRKSRTIKMEGKFEMTDNKYQNVDSFPYYSNVPHSNHPHNHTKNSINSCSQPRQFKSKPSDLNKQCKSNYSAEALIRGVPQSHWADTALPKSTKSSIDIPKQYSDLTSLQDSQFSQMPHFPPVLDLGESLTVPQQFTTNSFSYGTTPATAAPTFYPSHSFVPSNYMGSGFLPDFIDYGNLPTDNNFALPRLDGKTKDKKHQDNILSKSTPDQKANPYGMKPKPDQNTCKKESNKKQSQKRPRIHMETSWLMGSNDTNVPTASATITSPLLTDDAFLSYFPAPQVYQTAPTFSVPSSHSHIDPNVGMSAGHQTSCSLTTTIATAKTNFNLSTIFPEINKQQSSVGALYCNNVPVPPQTNRHQHNKNNQDFQFRNQP